MSAWEAVVGLEVHAQLRTRTKLFCACPNEFGAPPNTHVCPVCLGLPGALPAPNEAAIDLALRAALALGGEVRERSVFARKSYFYPDLAKGYQISQFALPIIEGGAVPMALEGEARSAALTRIHLEEDAAKNLHVQGETVVDFNRAGTPLIEIVGEPVLRSGAEAEAYLRALREVLVFIGVNDGNLEEGSFRCDANVSIRPKGEERLGTRVELKNINSFRFVRKAIDHEVARQAALRESGGEVVQETRTWDERQERTVAMRGKEEAHDYRYFPDPDLPPLVVDAARLARAEETLPELPAAMRARWVETLGLTAQDAGVLAAHPAIAAYFEAVVTGLGEAAGLKPAKAGKKAANFVMAEVLRETATEGVEARFPAAAPEVAALLALVEDGTINGKIAKEVFAKMVATGEPPKTIVEREGLAQVTDTAAIEAVVREVLAANPKQVEQYRGGKTAVLGFFVGQVMKATRGQANPKAVNEILRALLAEG